MDFTNQHINQSMSNPSAGFYSSLADTNQSAMDKEKMKLQQIVFWLNEQINHANEVISQSHRTNNVGRETQYEGMRDAFMRCLNMLSH